MSGRPYAEVIGDPIAHSKSPTIHNFWLGKLGIDGEYRACHVRPDELADYFTRRRGDAEWRGCNVTIPHKISACRFVDAVDPEALAIGAINTVVGRAGRLVAFNTDDAGFIDPLRSFPKTIKRATLIGAGGAARAILAALNTMEIPTVELINRDQSKLFELASAYPAVRTVTPLVQGLSLSPTDLVVNATALGMAGQPPLDVRLDGLSERTIVYDIVYSPLETPLLANARKRGMRTIDGLEMLVGQAAVAFAFLFDAPAPREHDAELRALLTA